MNDFSMREEAYMMMFVRVTSRLTFSSLYPFRQIKKEHKSWLPLRHGADFIFSKFHLKFQLPQILPLMPAWTYLRAPRYSKEYRVSSLLLRRIK